MIKSIELMIAYRQGELLGRNSPENQREVERAKTDLFYLDKIFEHLYNAFNEGKSLNLDELRSWVDEIGLSY